MIKPDFPTFKALSKQGNLIPMTYEAPGDFDTPLSAFTKIDDMANSFLLESVEGGTKWARYSILGSDPRLVVKIKNGTSTIEENGSSITFNNVTNIASFMKQVMSDYKPAVYPGCPGFYGGAVGFMSYDAARGFEKLPDLKRADPGFLEAGFVITKDVLLFDNLLNKIILITTVAPREFPDLDAAYDEGRRRLESLKYKLTQVQRELSPAKTSTLGQFQSNMSRTSFEAMVSNAKERIAAGDVIQVVLSQRFQGTVDFDPLNVYRGLRTINPAPYMFYLKIGDEILAGSSPEAMARLRNNEAVLRPIAGTRPRGATDESDNALALDLLADEKEIAEHVMLVDLARNDLGRIAAPGSVVVDEFKTIEKYSHVMHMVSNVKATPAEGIDAFEIVQSVFPAGTLSGAPKIKAMEIIEEMEPERRGPYGGCVGYFAFNGDMDMGITIRTVILKGNQAYFQSGAGIVADSIPEREYEETIRKAEAMKQALAIAANLPGRIK